MTHIKIHFTTIKIEFSKYIQTNRTAFDDDNYNIPYQCKLTFLYFCSAKIDVNKIEVDLEGLESLKTLHKF